MSVQKSSLIFLSEKTQVQTLFVLYICFSFILVIQFLVLGVWKVLVRA